MKTKEEVWAEYVAKEQAKQARRDALSTFTKCCRCFPGMVNHESGICGCCDWNHLTKSKEGTP